MARTSTSTANTLSHLFNMSSYRTFGKMATEPSPLLSRTPAYGAVVLLLAQLLFRGESELL